MKRETLERQLTYSCQSAASSPAHQIAYYNSAVMRALRPFPEASRAVIAELDRLERRAA
jgi:hypothetical protein